MEAPFIVTVNKTISGRSSRVLRKISFQGSAYQRSWKVLNYCEDPPQSETLPSPHLHPTTALCLSLNPHYTLWINFPLCWMAGTCSVDFRCTGGRFIARSVFVCGGIPRFYSAQEMIPPGRAHPSILCPSTLSNGPGKHDLLPNHTGGST
ncbi:hypothetical protein ILYODFUR_005698 [Ilyodon furcidens]|uniref:Uncharacterized protein n=1 Tax=Ilyodon furcidens TaxID=33524 RepID=A0ABV0UDM4_9TELE